MVIRKREDDKVNIAFIGAVGVPNRYGGFESFLENVAPEIARHGKRVIVTCYKNAYHNHDENYNGVERVFLHINANGILSPIHDFYAFLKVFRQVKNVVVLGVSAGPFFFVMRILGACFGTKIFVNIDGVEWRRDKYTFFGKVVLFLFDWIAQFASNICIYDNEGLLNYIYGFAKSKSVCIKYPGDHVLYNRNYKINVIPGTALTICRIEPENNLDILLQACLENALITEYTVIGNWNSSAYGINLRLKYSAHKKLRLLNPEYDPILLNEYRQRAEIYLHGHSVGGSNPSLIEMLFYDCKIYCYDCVFNRYTAGDRAGYFRNIEELTNLLRRRECTQYAHIPLEQYTLNHIALQYEMLFKDN